MRPLSTRFARVANHVLTKVAIVVCCALGTTSLVSTSVYATLNVRATSASPTSISSGTFSLTYADSPDNGLTDGFTMPITNMAIGDVVNRYVNISHGGTLTGGAVMLTGFANEATTPLLSDPTGGLFMAIRECSVPWNSIGLCIGGTQTIAMNSMSISIFTSSLFLGTSITPQPLALQSTAPGVTNYLKISWRLPVANDENVIDGVFPNGSVQNLTQTFNWFFRESPANTVTNS